MLLICFEEWDGMGLLFVCFLVACLYDVVRERKKGSRAVVIEGMSGRLVIVDAEFEEKNRRVCGVYCCVDAYVDT